MDYDILRDILRDPEMRLWLAGFTTAAAIYLGSLYAIKKAPHIYRALKSERVPLPPGEYEEGMRRRLEEAEALSRERMELSEYGEDMAGHIAGVEALNTKRMAAAVRRNERRFGKYFTEPQQTLVLR